MKNWFFAVFALFLLMNTGCSKYTTPKKVERKISEGSWKISVFTVDGVSILKDYEGYLFGFGDNNKSSVTRSGAIINGTWELGLNKNPAILYLSFPPGDGLELLADDWQVIEMKKDLMRLKRNGGSGSSNVTFKK